jgi:exodeoxyribonuclease V alpha subunit
MIEIDPAELSPLDDHFARFLSRHGASDRVAAAARLVSAARALGHACVPLSELTTRPRELLQELRASPVSGSPDEWRPLILDHAERLYLQRYWHYEQALAAAIRERLAAPDLPIDPSWLASALEEHLPAANEKTQDQRRAVRAAMLSRLSIITGGPGTGKTRTISVIVSLLVAHAARTGGELPHIALTAPTGKAAARMTEALQNAMGNAALPAARTLHRLLGISPDSSTPRYTARHPLLADAIIVDEASMIDLALMARLFAASPPTCRIVLLGDRDQLASVEAGHVLGEISGAAPGRSFVSLTQNFRFAQESGIHQLSVAINSGDADAALALLTRPTGADVSGQPLPAPAALPAALRERVTQAHHAAVTAHSAEESLQALTSFRILCALRRGPYGVEHVNRLAEGALAAAGLIHPNSRNYPGRPIMILQNEYHLGLFNGDMGLLLPDPQAGGELRAYFPGPQGVARRIHPARLPEHETVWAMSVHKSQGSEFERVLLLLPDRDSPVLTRELVYTAITRARSAIDVRFSAPVLRAAIARRTVRFSGLRDLLAAQGGADATATPFA